MFKTRVSILLLTILSAWALNCGTNKNASDATAEALPGQKPSIVEKMKEIDHLPVAERVAKYYRLKQQNPDAYNFRNEFELNMYGYGLLWDNKADEALAIFKLIVTEFPDSWNAYDSVAEAYLALGDSTASLRNYERSLAMNTANFGAEDQIERIKYPHRKPLTPAEKFTRIFTAAQYRADLDQLGATLLKVHPNALKFISQETFQQVIDEKKALITDHTTYGEFAWHCSEIVASVCCSHTSTGRFYPEYKMLPPALRFPLQTRWLNDRLYVIDPLNSVGQLAVRDEIEQINGKAVGQLIRDIYRHLPAQGHIETTKQHLFNTWSVGLIPYALGFPNTYTIAVKGRKEPLVLPAAEAARIPFNDPLQRCNDLCFEVLDDQTAVLTITTFNYYPWNNLAVFQQFIDRSFEEINRKGIKNLVIDVRFNGGGSSESSIHLLRYLADRPFTYYSTAAFEGKTEKLFGEGRITPFKNRFNGKLYFLTDGNGNSTTGHFMSLVKVWNLGVIVGEELGSNQFCSAGQTICRLSNTKLEYGVANNTHISTATALPDERGILPDHTIVQSIDDYLAGTDTVRNFTLNLIKNKR